MRYNFTAEEVITEIRKTFDESVCLDLIDVARTRETIEQAAECIIIDSELWNGTLNA